MTVEISLKTDKRDSPEFYRYDLRWFVTDAEAEEAFQLLKTWWNERSLGLTKCDSDRVAWERPEV